MGLLSGSPKSGAPAPGSQHYRLFSVPTMSVGNVPNFLAGNIPNKQVGNAAVDQLHAYIFCTFMCNFSYSSLYQLFFNVIYLMYIYLYMRTLTDINRRITR